ncbi:MAG: TrkH family potassium uptake protein [Sedimentibacter sp.]
MKKIFNTISDIKRNPYLVFFLGFASIILIGTVLLALPVASISGKSAGFVDALFTSASATCVTGLAVVSTAEYWTVFGKFVIILLIQIGGLGVMTMTAMISFFFGKRISLKTRVLIMEERNVDELQGVVRLTKNILLFTFISELVGAILLSIVFIDDYGIKKGIAFSLFHSISAFCNAGFDLTGNSMMNYVDNPIITITISFLVIIGGIGFYVFWEIISTKKIHMLSLHTKLVIIVTSILLVGGTLVIFLLEYNNPGTMGNLNLSGKIQASIFHAVVPRTAGFNTLPLENFRISTAVIIMVLMFIGGSPASTAGGIKTTTIGVLFISLFNLVRGKRDCEVFERRILPEVTIKAAAILMISTTLIMLVTIILSITEDHLGYDFLDILFETVSAFATVGLTRGITPFLSDAGKIVLTFLMFIGRVGPITVAYALLKEHKNIGNYTYPEGKIIVG